MNGVATSQPNNCKIVHKFRNCKSAEEEHLFPALSKKKRRDNGIRQEHPAEEVITGSDF